MSTYTHPLPRAVPQAVRHLVWFALVCAVAFLVPYLGVSVLDQQHDVFYLLYFVVTIALVAGYVRAEHVDVAGIFRHRWRWSTGIGVVLAVVLVFNVFNTEDATARPHGAYFVFELLWRGVGYGLIDTLLLTVFPSAGLHAPARARRRPEGEAALHGAVPAAGDRRHGDLSPRLPAVPRRRPQPPRDRQHPDLDPDLRDREPGRLVRRARLAARRRRHAQLRIEDLQPTGDEGMTTAAHDHPRKRRPVFGLRRQPGRLVLVFMRTPRPLYHRGWGRLLGHTFLLITHQGRKSGKRRETVAMALTLRPETLERPWSSRPGGRTPNGCETCARIRRCEIQIGRETYVPTQHFLSEDEAVAVTVEFRHAIPGDCASSRRSSAGATSAPRPRCGSSFVAGRSSPSDRRTTSCTSAPTQR